MRPWCSALARAACAAARPVRPSGPLPEWLGGTFALRVRHNAASSLRNFGGSNTFPSVGALLPGLVVSQAAQSKRAFTAAPTKDAAPAKERVFAVVKVGGKQYKVCENDNIVTEQLPGKRIGDKVKVNEVLLVGSATETLLGAPHVAGAYVEVVVEQQTLSEKVYIFKKRRRKNSRRLRGYRASVSSLRVVAIHHPGKSA